MITMQHVRKTYKVFKRDAGFSSAFKALFHKEYEYIHVLDDVSFTIQDGEMVGYIGPNGAGKNSTIKILSGILTPEEGTCLINGLIPWKNRIEHVKNIGVVFGQRSQLWWDVPVMDSFELLKEIYKISAPSYQQNLERITVQAIAMFAYGFAVSDVHWTIPKAAAVLLMLIGGTVVFSGIFLIYASICFFTLEGLEFINIFTDGAREYGKYPVCIYGKRILQLSTFVIPYALIQYYPLLYLLDRRKPYYGFLPLIACLFMIPCLLLWKLGVRHYKSCGS